MEHERYSTLLYSLTRRNVVFHGLAKASQVADFTARYGFVYAHGHLGDHSHNQRRFALMLPHFIGIGAPLHRNTQLFELQPGNAWPALDYQAQVNLYQSYFQVMPTLDRSWFRTSRLTYLPHNALEPCFRHWQ